MPRRLRWAAPLSRTRWAAGAFLCCGLASGACTAADAPATADIAWSCHAAAGSYDERFFAVPELTTHFAASMTFLSVDQSTKWQPYAKAAFVDRTLTSPDCHCNGVAATVYANLPNSPQIATVADGQEREFGSVPYDRPITPDVTFLQNGAMTVRVGTAAVGGSTSTPRRNAIMLTCSSADVDFRITAIR